MGRKKINIARIDNDRKRSVTFNKRKVGLIKKAVELSVLCDCEVAMVILKDGKMCQYSSSDIDMILSAHKSYDGDIEVVNNDDAMRDVNEGSVKKAAALDANLIGGGSFPHLQTPSTTTAWVPASICGSSGGAPNPSPDALFGSMGMFTFWPSDVVVPSGRLSINLTTEDRSFLGPDNEEMMMRHAFDAVPRGGNASSFNNVLAQTFTEKPTTSEPSAVVASHAPGDDVVVAVSTPNNTPANADMMPSEALAA